MSENLDRYFKDDLFKSCDCSSEESPTLYNPDFSTCGDDTGPIQSENTTGNVMRTPSQTSTHEVTDDLPILSSSKMSSVNLNNYFRSDSIYKTEGNTASNTHPQGLPSETVLDLTESLANLTNTPLQSSKFQFIEEQSENSTRSNAILNGYFRSNSIYMVEENNSTNTTGHLPGDSGTVSEVMCDILDTQKREQEDVFLNKLEELEREVNQLERLQKNCSTTEAPGSSGIQRPKLSSRISMSDSDIHSSVEDELMHSSVTNTLNEVEQDSIPKSVDDISIGIKQDRLCTTRFSEWASLSFGNIKTNLLNRLPKHNKDTPDGTSKNVSMKVDAHMELSCPCRRPCARVERLVTTQGGFVWVSFYRCSWVSLYDHQHERVYKFDTRGDVDSLAVSASGVLYVSCPPQKRILMLSSNLEMTVLITFNTLYPRGIAVSPYDGSLVVCMTSQHVGSVMDGPSKDSCLMKFKGETPNKYGKKLNKENHFGYPVKIIINKNENLLVSDFGFNCLFVLDKEGNMLRTFSSLGGEPLRRKLALTSNSVNSFIVVQGGSGALSITRLGEYLGTFEEISTSTKEDPSIKSTVVTSSMNTKGKIVLASGDIITYVSLLYSK